MQLDPASMLFGSSLQNAFVFYNAKVKTNPGFVFAFDVSMKLKMKTIKKKSFQFHISIPPTLIKKKKKTIKTAVFFSKQIST